MSVDAGEGLPGCEGWFWCPVIGPEGDRLEWGGLEVADVVGHRPDRQPHVDAIDEFSQALYERDLFSVGPAVVLDSGHMERR